MVEKSGQPLQPTIEIDSVILADVNGDEVEAYLLEEGHVVPSDVDVGVATDAACAEHGEVTVNIDQPQSRLSRWASSFLSKS